MISLVLVVAIAFGSLAATLLSGWRPELGLDLAGGLSVVYKPATHATAADLTESVNILTNRVNALGVSGAQVATQGPDIVVSIPGIKNPQQILSTIGETAQLYFRPALCGAPAFVGKKGKGAQPPSGPLPTCTAASTLSKTNLGATPSSSATSGYTANPVPADAALAAYPSTPASQDVQGKTVLLPALKGGGQYPRYLLGPATLTGHAIKTATAQQNQTGSWVVNYTLTSTGSPAWDALAQQNFHQIIAIELDGVVQSAPIIQPGQATFSSFAGTGQISGNLTQHQAQNLALAMQFGSLPVRLVPQTTQTVSPTLGASSLKAGLLAGIIGLLLVLGYVVFYYRALGLVVVSGLCVTAALLWAIVSVIGHTNNLTLDLAGVTGLIVSIGITVDSYIVYFERLKDETRSGRTVRTSVDRGFSNAWRTVLAADMVSLLGALLLWFIAIGAVRGFAFFLGLSTLLDVFVTYFFTRPLVVLLGKNEKVADAKRFGIARGLDSSVQVTS